MSLIERGDLESVTFDALQRVVDAVEGRLVLDVQWAGAELDHLLDAGHAALAEWLAAFLRQHGWEVHPEVSFNHFGDRGRYDLIAFHPLSRCLLVVEIKTAIGDVQDLLGRLDVKVRLSRRSAQSFGWRPSAVVPMLLVADDGTNRRRVGDHPTLFARFQPRGRQASAWLRDPAASSAGGLLVFRKISNANHRGLNRVRRVRKPQAQTTAGI